MCAIRKFDRKKECNMSIETAVSKLKDLKQSGQQFEGYVLVQNMRSI